MPSPLAREEVSFSTSALSASKPENRDELFKAGLGADLPINLVLLITYSCTRIFTCYHKTITSLGGRNKSCANDSEQLKAWVWVG